MTKELKGRKIAILATDGYEQSEMMEPKNALENAGAEVHVVSLKSGTIKGWKQGNWAGETRVDRTLDQANPEEYQALMLPGGVINPDKLRLEEKAIDFIKYFVKKEKPIAAICHGAWTLINAEGVKGKTLTSWPSIKTDLMNAGAEWINKEVVRDGNLITSRRPEDLPAFNEEMVRVFSEQTKQRMQNK